MSTTWSDDRAAAANAVSMWISVWQRESGIDRADARLRAQTAIRYFRRFHRDPERAAFQAAVARSRSKTKGHAEMPIGIDKGIPLPGGFKVGRIYPFRDMAIGDSVVLPADQHKRISAAASNYKIRNPEFNYTTRTRIEEGRSVVRLWRIQP